MDIPTVVIIALAFSLIECLLILPAHLAHMRPVRPAGPAFLARLEAVRETCAEAMVNFAANVYRPFLEKCLRANLLTISLFFRVPIPVACDLRRWLDTLRILPRRSMTMMSP